MIDSYMYSLDIVIILIAALLFVMLRGKRKADIDIYRIYNALLFNVFMTAVFDLLFAESIANVNVYGYKFMEIIGAIYLSSLLFLDVLFTVYVLALAGINFLADRRWQIAVSVPYIVSEGYILYKILFGNLLIRSIEGYDKYSKFEFTVTYIVYYMLLWIVILCKYRKAVDKYKKLYIKLFLLVQTFAIMVYFVTDFSGIFAFVLSIILIALIYAVQSPDEFYDKSDAMLAKYLKQNVKLELSRDKAFSLIYVRIHDVDIIYDSFGDINANRILGKFVEAVSEINKSVVVYRNDRNTFVIKTNNIDRIRLHAIRRNIIDRCEKEFRIGDIRAKLSVGLVTVNAPENVKNEEKFYEIDSFIKNAIIPIGSDFEYNELLENDKDKEVIEAVKKAVENNGFQVFYQPIYSTDKKRIVAAEALIRLFDDKLGFVSPERFIPLAEREGYILEIGEFVFTEVCRFYSENKLNQKGIDYIEVNLSAVQCMQYKLADEFVAIMHKYGLNSSQINFEITETSVMNKNSAVELNIHYFVDHGVDLSLDDYGTGYSNISYLYNMPFAFMKIDKSILWSSDKNDKANITLQNIFKMAKNLQMRIVVEGVETEEHVKKLLELECDYFQGYYFSKPICGKDFINYLNDFKVPEVCLS